MKLRIEPDPTGVWGDRYTVQCEHGGACLHVSEDADTTPALIAHSIRRLVQTVRYVGGCQCGQELLDRYGRVEVLQGGI